MSAATQVSQDYLACLKDNTGDASKCRDLSKLYLQCRMDRCFYTETLLLQLLDWTLNEALAFAQLLQCAEFKTVLCYRNLMAKQDLKELGFRSEDKPQSATQTKSLDSNTDKQKQGFIAGMRR